MELLVIVYFLAALLGVKLGKGWLARRPALSWTVVGLGVAGLVALGWAGRRMPVPLSQTLIPLMACLAVGVAVSRMDMSLFWRVLVLAYAAASVWFFCCLNIPWRF